MGEEAQSVSEASRMGRRAAGWIVVVQFRSDNFNPRELDSDNWLFRNRGKKSEMGGVCVRFACACVCI